MTESLHGRVMSSYPRILPAGDAALTIEFGESIDPDINDRVLAFVGQVESLGLPGIVEVVPAYRSATVYYDPLVIDAAPLGERLQTFSTGMPLRAGQAPRTVEIPVAYGDEFGPDLPAVAAFAGLSIDDAVALHSSVEYRCYMLGFSPGFPYLGPVPGAIAMPRLAEPRATVPCGSVAIAGSQTGIYPHESPGGWRLIGLTPLRLFDPMRPQPFLIQAGDRVRFVPVQRDEYERLSRGSGVIRSEDPSSSEDRGWKI